MRGETIETVRRCVLGAIALGALLVPQACPARVAGMTPRRFESGTYDVLTRGASDPLPVATSRAVALHVHKLTIEADTYVDGTLRLSRILVPDGPVQYDLTAHRWYQDFETKPNNPKATHERVRIWFREDALGTYDISYRRRDDTWASEILVKRPD